MLFGHRLTVSLQSCDVHDDRLHRILAALFHRVARV